MHYFSRPYVSIGGFFMPFSYNRIIVISKPLKNANLPFIMCKFEKIYSS